MQFHVENQIWSDKVAIRMRVGSSIAKSINFEPYDNRQFSEPFLYLEREQAQELMDRLYAVGISPSKSLGSAGQLESVKYHLEDMRKIALDSIAKK